MKKLYLDHNIVIDLINENMVIQDVLNNDEFDIFYSPAHMEEIAVSEKRYKTPKEMIKKDLEGISKLTLNKILLPNHGDRNCNNSICEEIEHPLTCYQRVIDQYQVNDEVEIKNEAILAISTENNFFGNVPFKINNTPHERILKKLLDEVHITHKEMFIFNYNNHIRSINESFSLNLELLNGLSFRFEDFQDNFFKLSIIIEMLANLLEANGYFYEKPNHKKQPLIEKARSRTHDVSHMIYASSSNKFITADKKMFQKTKAIYSYLGIKTEVLWYKQKTKELLSKI